MKLAARRISLIATLFLLQNSAIAQAPTSTQTAGTGSGNTTLDKWLGDVDATNFSQQAAQGLIDGNSFKAVSAHFEPNQVFKGQYYLVVSDAAKPPNEIRIGLAKTPSYYYGKTMTHHFDNFKDPDITAGMTNYGTSDAKMAYHGTARCPSFSLKMHIDKPNAKGLLPCYLVYRAKIEPRSSLEGYVFAKPL